MGEKQRSSLLRCLICITKICERKSQKSTARTPKGMYVILETLVGNDTLEKSLITTVTVRFVCSR